MALAADAFHARGDQLPNTHGGNPLLKVDDGIATVSIEGPILRKPDLFSRIIFGAIDSEEVGTALREASERDDIRAVFLEIDSPGGTVAGTPELAAAVKSLDNKKPVYAFSSGLMCSAAYWIASQARAVHATPSSQVGSIGVVQTIIDNSARLHAAGIKVEVFAVGKYKSMGAPGTSLTDDQRDLIRGKLADTARDFHAAVRAHNREIPVEAMEGQTFSGRQAKGNQLATLVTDRAESMNRLRLLRGVVDTDSRAMNGTPEELLVAATAQVESLQTENEAQADLLTEASATQEQLKGEVTTLTTRIDSLTTERDEARTQIETLNTRISDLEEAQSDFDERVQSEAARIVASTGTSDPALVTPGGDDDPPADASAADLIARFDALVAAGKPEEAAAFYQTHLAPLLTQ